MIYRVLALGLLAGVLWRPAFLAAQETTNPGITIHVVQRGENLFRIALQYGMTTDELAQLNGITNPNNIQVGQRLLVPTQAGAEAAEVPQTHVVQAGETLQGIADQSGLTLEQLASQNNIASGTTIYVGQVLNLTFLEAPTAVVSPSLESSSSASSVIHTVQPGETLFRIATAYGLTVNELARANSISDPTLIYSGQQLLIPGVQPPVLALDLPPVVTGVDITPQILVEGQTGRFRLTTSVPMTVSGTFLGRMISAASEQNGTFHVILVGIPMFTAGAVYPLVLNLTDSNGQSTPLSLDVQIVAGSYGSEYINLLADRSGLLDPTVESAEQTLVQNVMSVFTPTRYFDGPLGLPAAAPMTSPFGRRRSYNGGAFDRFHTGTDFAGVPGTPILATAPGYVVFAETLNVRGNATIIDHGWGVYSGYWHQNEIYVKPGDFVAMGQTIGTIGATGRVTGTHLHWEVWVNGVPVDPMQWVRQVFTS